MTVIANAGLVLKDSQGNKGIVKSFTDNDIDKISSAITDVGQVVDPATHMPIEATKTSAGVVQLATAQDITNGTAGKVVDAQELNNFAQTLPAANGVTDVSSGDNSNQLVVSRIGGSKTLTIDNVEHASNADEATHASRADTATSANSVAWNNVSGKPSSYTPSSHTHDDRYYTESEIDTKLSGKSDTTHNHNSAYLGITAKAESAKSADSVAWNNVSGKPSSFTPASHTHTKSQITDFPTIPTVNNATLTIQKNGSNVATFTANASSNATANITVPTKTSELTNNSGYITSSSNITGNAATATKLATARSISAGDLEFQGSANFDGSGNIKLNITQHRSIVTVGNKNNYPFHRIAYTAVETGNYLDRAITFFIGKECADGGYGICRIVLRTNNASGGGTANCEVTWLVRTSSISVDAIQVGFNNTAAASYVDVFYKSSGSYSSAICRVISHASSRTNVGQGFTVVSTSSEVDNTTASNPLTSTESYATIAAAGTKIRGKAYTSTIIASDAGNVNYANSAGSAGSVAWSNVSGKPSSYTPSSHTHDDRYYTESEINTKLSNLLLQVYPVGSIYISANSTNPGTLFGGTWKALDQGRVLIGANSTYKAGTTGGEFTHKITTGEMPSHTHTGTTGNESAGHTHSGTTGNQSAGHTHTWSGTTSSNGSHGHTASSNSTGSHQHNSGRGWHYVDDNTSETGSRHCLSDAYIESDSWSKNVTSSNGAHSHTITVNSNGAHTHTVSGTTGGISANHTHSFTTGGISAHHNHSFTTGASGSGSAMNNMQPYLAVYMWQRTK